MYDLEIFLFVQLIILTMCLAQHMPQSDKPEMDILYDNCSRYNYESAFGGPVCGSDGVTYANKMHMNCHSYKRINETKIKPEDEIKVLHMGHCSNSMSSTRCSWSPVYEPVCGSDNATYANVEALECAKKKTPDKASLEMIRRGECVTKDPCNLRSFTLLNGVCASNGKTYTCVEQIRCLVQHKSGISILHEGGCSVDEVLERYKKRAAICSIAYNNFEWNPICDSSGKTLPNPWIFICHRPLGVPRHQGQCNDKRAMSCELAKMAEFKPLCGTDGLTYSNHEALTCASLRNKHIRLKHLGACTMDDSPCRDTEIQNGGKPVCGTDGVTYAHPSALFCVMRSKDPHLLYHHDGKCLNQRLKK